MADWTPTPFAGQDHWNAERLHQAWTRLHHGDAEPWPEQDALLQAWLLFHNGEFQRATEAGLALGDAGVNVANKASCIYATYIEPHEQPRQDLLLQIAARAEDLQQRQPENLGAWYWQAYALGRYSQGISVAKALTLGLGVRIRHALEAVLARSPQHVNALLTMASYHAEVIDKVGSMVGGMTYGADKAQGLALYQRAMALQPDSIVTLTECAYGLVMLEGPNSLPQANHLLERATALTPLDTMERLYQAAARVSLES